MKKIVLSLLCLVFCASPIISKSSLAIAAEEKDSPKSDLEKHFSKLEGRACVLGNIWTGTLAKISLRCSEGLFYVILESSEDNSLHMLEKEDAVAIGEIFLKIKNSKKSGEKLTRSNMKNFHTSNFEFLP